MTPYDRFERWRRSNRNASKGDAFREWRRLFPDTPIEHFARWIARPPFDPDAWVEMSSKGVELILDGYRVVVKATDDEYFAPSEHYGEFVDEFDFPKTLKRRGTIRGGEYACFRPTISVAEASAAYHAGGMSRAAAYHRALADAYETMERCEAYPDRWAYIVITATVYALDDEDCETELGFDSIGGVESDSGRDYLSELALDTARNAIDEARRAVAA